MKTFVITITVLIMACTAFGTGGSSTILFTRAPVGTSDYDIFTMNGDGADVTIRLDVAGDAQLMHWSDDLSAIVFSSNGSSTTGRHELFVMDADYTNVTQVSSFGDYWGQSTPRFVGPSTLWWARNQVGEVCKINTDGSGYSVLTNFRSFGKSVGQIDVRNNLIVYSKQSTSNARTFDIYSNNLSFTNEQALTSNSVADVGPEISPDGSQILFVRSNAPNGYSIPKNIYIMNADGSNLTKLTFASGSQTYGLPLWSDDGSQIICYYRDGSQTDVMIMNADGSNAINITDTPGYNEAPYDWRMVGTDATIVAHLDIKPKKCPNVIKIEEEDDEDDDGDEEDGFADYGYDGAAAKNKHDDDDDDDDGKKIKVAVLGTADFDVNSINIASLQLAGVEPSQRRKIKDKSTPVDDTAACACSDEGKDGFDDLVLKFRQSELLEAIGPINDGDEIVLTLTGELDDGTPFEGSDCVVIRIEEEEDDDDDGGGSKSSLADNNSLPTEFALAQNYPNPFNPATAISFSLPDAGDVRLDVYNVRGQKVATLVNSSLAAGEHRVQWDASDKASGMYLYRLTTSESVITRKMLLLK